MVERLVLVSSGGLGPEVSPVLRAAALPGADLFIAATAGVGSRVGSAARARPRRCSACAPAPTSPRSRAATPRSPTPTAARPSSRPCARWSAPTASGSPPRPPLPGRGAAAADRLGRPRPDHPGRATPKRRTVTLPGSRLEIFEGVGHVPQLEEPGALRRRPRAFLDETEPADSTATSGAPASPRSDHGRSSKNPVAVCSIPLKPPLARPINSLKSAAQGQTCREAGRKARGLPLEMAQPPASDADRGVASSSGVPYKTAWPRRDARVFNSRSTDHGRGPRSRTLDWQTYPPSICQTRRCISISSRPLIDSFEARLVLRAGIEQPAAKD